VHLEVESTVILFCLIGGIYGYNQLTLYYPVAKVIQEDQRNEGIQIDLHYEHYVLGSALVYDLTNVSNDKTAADVFRVFLQSAKKLSSHHFEKVVISFRGKSKFYIDGDYFNELGIQFGEQNPIYTIRTFPQNIHDLNGKKAFETWEGGIFGVLKEQMDDFNEFNKMWYLNELGIKNTMKLPETDL